MNTASGRHPRVRYSDLLGVPEVLRGLTDAQIQALASLVELSGAGILAKLDAAFATRQLRSGGAGLSVQNGNGAGGDPTIALTEDVASIEDLSGFGIPARVDINRWLLRSLVAPAAGISITHPNGRLGNPTFGLKDDLAALEGIATTGLARRTGADTWNADNLWTATEATYVAKWGSDTNAGITPELPKLTIAAGITAAAALVAGGAPQALVQVLDGAQYTENISLTAGVHVRAEAARLVGTVSLDSDTSIHLHEHYAAAAGTAMVLKATVSGHAYYRSHLVDTRGLGGALTPVIAFLNGSNGSVLHCDADLVFVGASNGGVLDIALGFGHTHFRFGDLYLAGNNATGLGTLTSGSDLIGYIDHILMLGAPTGTTAISLGAAGSVVKLTVNEIVANTAYNVAAGDLFLVCANITGTRTGVANVTGDTASETLSGKVELATAVETQAGTSTTLAVHPAGAKSAFQRKLSVSAEAASRSIDADDDAAVLRVTASSTFTLPNVAIGTLVQAINIGAVTTTLAAGGGMTLSGPTSVTGDGGVITFLQTTATEWESWASSPTSTDGCGVRRAANQSIPNNTNTPISFDTEEWDDAGMWVIGSPTVITIPAGGAGRYLLAAGAVFASNSTGSRSVSISVNGATACVSEAQLAATVPQGIAISRHKVLAAGDTVSLVLFQSSGGALNALGGEFTFLSVQRVK